MGWNDRTTRHNLSIIVYVLSAGFAAALILTGLAGAIWAVTEAVNQVMTWVL